MAGSDTEKEEVLIPEFEANLPENTPSNPNPTAFVVHNPNVSSRQVHLNLTSSHSVPVNMPPGPFPKDDHVDYTKNQPAKYNNNIALKDEYLQIKFDPLGEKKISKNGFFKDHDKNTRIVVSTFTLPGKGKKLYVMATDISKELQYRDSYLFLHKNKSLIKYLANEADKAFLIKHGILQSVFKSRTIGVVTFRSLYLIYGARLLKSGKRLEEDYWEQLGREEGFTENDPVFNIHTEPSAHSNNNYNSNGNESHSGNRSGGMGSSTGDLLKDFNFNSKSDLKNLSLRILNSGNDLSGDKVNSNSLYSQLLSKVPVPVSIENHPFLTNSKFKVYENPNYRLNYSQHLYLNNLLLQEPSDEVKQNYLLSSGIANAPILSKPAISYNHNHQLVVNKNITITSPGGSIPQSITSSLFNNESLISSNGDNIYYVSCLQGQGIAGTINLSKNIVLPNYRLAFDEKNQTDKSRLEEMLSNVPLSTDKNMLGKKSHAGLKFYNVNNVIKKVIALQKPESLDAEDKKSANKEGLILSDNNKEDLILSADNSEMNFKGTCTGIKNVRSLEYQHNVVSVNQNINNFRKLRSQQWKYYWFDKTGGYNLLRKNLKKKIMHEQKEKSIDNSNPSFVNVAKSLDKPNETDEETKPDVIEGKYFNYRVIPKNEAAPDSLDDSNSIVDIDLNEDSDQEVIDERLIHLPSHYQLSPADRTRLERQKAELTQKYNDQQKQQQEEGFEFFNDLEFQQMLRIRTVKRRKPNPNAVSYSLV